MSLIEQRKQFMSRLQKLIDAKNEDIDKKVSAYREQLETEHVQPFRAQLEKEKVTPEMNKLVEFIGYVDEMLTFENANDVVETVEETCIEEAIDTPAFQLDIKETVDEENAETINSSFDAIAADVSETNKKLQSVTESRPGMPGIILPRR